MYFFVQKNKKLHSGQFSLDLAPFGQGSVLGQILDGGAVREEATVGPHLFVVFAVELGEAPLLGHVNLKRGEKKLDFVPSFLEKIHFF